MFRQAFSIAWIVGALCVVSMAPTGPALSPVASQALTNLWQALLESDARKAFKLMRLLAQTPNETLVFLRAKMPPAEDVKPEILDRLIRQLGSERFQEREQARRQLETYDSQALDAMRKAAKGDVDLEVRHRLDTMIARQTGPPTGPLLRQQRALEVVEWIGTDEARALMERWSLGAADARLTLEAWKILKRWGWRPEYRPGSRPWAPAGEPAMPSNITPGRTSF